jgi:hypothetical protein
MIVRVRVGTSDFFFLMGTEWAKDCVDSADILLLLLFLRSLRGLFLVEAGGSWAIRRCSLRGVCLNVSIKVTQLLTDCSL